MAAVRAQSSFSQLRTQRNPHREAAATRFTRTPVAQALICLVIGTFSWAPAPSAWAQSEPAATDARRSFDVPAGSLDHALSRFGRQAGAQIAVNAELTAGLKSVGVSGSYTLSEALRLLLAGTGLHAVRDASGEYTLRKSPASHAGRGARSEDRAGQTTLQTVVVTANAERDATSEGTASYTTKSTNTATGLNLSMRETPQSVSVITQERIKDQAMPTVGEALKATPGVSFQPWDHGRTRIAARGFPINSFQYDGVPVDAINIGPEVNNTTLYDRVEVVRGATGLLSGAGNPSASVNMIRKHADSTTFTGSIEGTIGSWGHRGAAIDLTAPLNSDGTVRARMIANTATQNSFINLERTNGTTLYGVIDADLDANTRVSIGASDQRDKRSGVYWGGLNYWYADGTRTDWERSKTTATKWNQWDTSIQTVFATLEHNFSNDWKARLDYNFNKLSEESNLLYVYGSSDRVTGQGMLSERNHYITKPIQNQIRLTVDGKFGLMGRVHDVFAGVSYSQFKGGWDNGRPGASDAPIAIADFNRWNGDVPQPPVDSFFSDRYTTTQVGAYAATRINLSDDLKAILGARVSNYKKDLSISDSRHWFKPFVNEKRGVVTPYAGLIFNLNDQWSTYAIFTSIFLPQDNKRTQGGSYLDPLVGKSYEAGVKGENLAGALNVAAAVFRIDQDNYAISDGLVAGTTSVAYRTAEGVRTQGYELEASGRISSNLDVGAGWTQYSVKDGKNIDVLDQHPRKLLKIFAKYSFEGDASGWSIGGGVNWQSQPLVTLENPVTGLIEKVGQPAYALVDAMVRYSFNKKTSIQLNIGNLFDKKYYSSGYDWVVYGKPRNARLTISHRF